MKKKIIILVCFIIVLAGVLFFIINKNSEDKNDKNTLKEVKVAEVAHTIFYAPAYAAISKGYFEDEGIKIDLTLTAGADKVTAAVLSGDVDVGFCGSEATIYVYNSGEKDYLVNFARLTKKDGSFLVSRKKYDNFKLEDLKGKTVIGGRKGGMPEMTFEWALKQNNIASFIFRVDHRNGIPLFCRSESRRGSDRSWHGRTAGLYQYHPARLMHHYQHRLRSYAISGRYITQNSQRESRDYQRRSSGSYRAGKRSREARVHNKGKKSKCSCHICTIHCPIQLHGLAFLFTITRIKRTAD